MGLFTRKKQDKTLDDLKKAHRNLRAAVQQVSMIEGPDEAAAWLTHYHGLLTTNGGWRTVAVEMHLEYKKENS